MERSRMQGRAVVAATALAMAGTVAIAAENIPGPAVGEAIPAIKAVDHEGATRDFSSLAGERGLVLLFFRSADW